MTEDDRKLLTEFLGLCWHEWDDWKRLCVNCNCHIPSWVSNRTFATRADLWDLYQQLQEKGLWPEFYYWCYEIIGKEFDDCDFTAWFISPDRCQTVVDFLKEKVRLSP